MQIVYVSKRPEMLARTLEYVALYMKFIDQFVVCVPDDISHDFSDHIHDAAVSIVKENSILSKEQRGIFNALDHQSRNYLLRIQLIKQPYIERQFILSDDDSRPIQAITKNHFFFDSQYRSYYFSDLCTWENRQTDFDQGQISTGAILQSLDLPHLSYASHMPQIVDKRIFLESVEFFSRFSRSFPLCEWSTYFNYAHHHYPDRFVSAQSYVTLGWPEHPNSWPTYVHQSKFLFENVTPCFYRDNHVFGGLTEAAVDDEERQDLVNIEKIIRWKNYILACRHPDAIPSAKKFLNPRVWLQKLCRPVIHDLKSYIAHQKKE